MKEFQEETYQKKNKELIKKLKKKDQILLTALKNKQKSKMKERQKIIEAMMEKEKKSKEKVQNFLEKQEKDRQKLQIDTDGKSNYIIYNEYIIIILLLQLNHLSREIRKRGMRYRRIFPIEIKIQKKGMKRI